MAGPATKLGHLERTSAEPREKNLLQVTIVGVERANEKIRLLRLGLRDGPSKFVAGQWLDTFVPGNPKPGGFTIASPPSAAWQAAEPYFELAVQEAPENPAATWLWKPEIEVLGEILEVRVGGSFVCPPPEGLGGIRRIILVAGGVGINPLMSILGYVADEKERLNMHVSVLYGTKVPEDEDLGKVLFLDRIIDLFQEDRVRGSVKLFLTGSASHRGELGGVRFDGVGIRFGRMEQNDVLSEIQASEGKDTTLVYVCGPPAMTDWFVGMLTAPGMASIIDSGHVKSEKWW